MRRGMGGRVKTAAVGPAAGCDAVRLWSTLGVEGVAEEQACCSTKADRRR